jgi:hypothetical protein
MSQASYLFFPAPEYDVLPELEPLILAGLQVIHTYHLSFTYQRPCSP